MQDEKKQNETKGMVVLNNTPMFYREYIKNWLSHKRRENANPVEIAIMEDISKLVEIAIGVLQPVSAEPTK